MFETDLKSCLPFHQKTETAFSIKLRDRTALGRDVRPSLET